MPSSRPGRAPPPPSGDPETKSGLGHLEPQPLPPRAGAGEPGDERPVAGEARRTGCVDARQRGRRRRATSATARRSLRACSSSSGRAGPGSPRRGAPGRAVPAAGGVDPSRPGPVGAGPRAAAPCAPALPWPLRVCGRGVRAVAGRDRGRRGQAPRAASAQPAASEQRHGDERPTTTSAADGQRDDGRGPDAAGGGSRPASARSRWVSADASSAPTHDLDGLRRDRVVEEAGRARQRSGRRVRLGVDRRRHDRRRARRRRGSRPSPWSRRSIVSGAPLPVRQNHATAPSA